MNELLLHLIDTLSLPLEERAARRALRDFAQGAGFDFFAYLHLRGSESFAVSNYPREWQELYLENDYLKIDPVVTRAKGQPAVFSWSAEEARRVRRSDEMQFYEDAERFGIRSGLSVSVQAGFWDRMVFTLASGKPHISIGSDPNPLTAAIAVAFVHARLGSAAGDTTLASQIQLSPREAECLKWFSEGMPIQEIAETVGIAYRSVRSYLDEATRKLDAGNNRRAASIAIRLGLI